MISEILKNLRIKNNLTQKELAEKIGTKQRTYCTYENGTREPNIETLKKIANFYNVSIDYLVGRYKQE